MWTEAWEWIIGAFTFILALFGIYRTTVRQNAKNEGRIDTLEEEVAEMKTEIADLRRFNTEELHRIIDLVTKNAETNAAAHERLVENYSHIRSDMAEIKGWIKGTSRENIK